MPATPVDVDQSVHRLLPHDAWGCPRPRRTRADHDETNAGGVLFEVLVEHAAYAIEAGAADVVLITYGSVQLSQMGRRLGTGRRRWRWGPPLTRHLRRPLGNTLVGSYARAARRHMYQFGTTSEQLASVAVTMRQHAASNPQAQERVPITVEDVISSRLVADPLHKLDCCVISDGGGACVLATAERVPPTCGGPPSTYWAPPTPPRMP